MAWIAQQGLHCTYQPSGPGSAYAQWTCHDSVNEGLDRSVVLDGDERGVFTIKSQLQAPEGERIVDVAAALTALKNLSLTAPLNAGIRDAVDQWLDTAPPDASATVRGISVRFLADKHQILLGFTYPPNN